MEHATWIQFGEEKEGEDDEKNVYNVIPSSIRADWFIVLISLQSDLIYNSLVSLTSPIFYLYRRAATSTANIEKAVHRIPANVGGGLRRVFAGLLGALFVFMFLGVLMLLAAMAGVTVVRAYAEEPVDMRESLFFDYTDANPSAVFSFQGVDKKRRQVGVPVGSSLCVSLELLMPESDFNRQIGPFQITAELLSVDGDIIAKSSQPCMLRFRSLPVRLTRTFLFGVPLVIGVSSEAQTMSVDTLKHKEVSLRTRTVRITLIPRAGTSALPHLYEAKIIVSSRPPWMKRMAYNWKWTLYVWTSLYLYIVSLVAVLCCFRPIVFRPVFSQRRRVGRYEVNERESEGRIETEDADQGDVVERIRRRRQRRSKQKAESLQMDFSGTAVSSASSVTTRCLEEKEMGDSESVCSGGC